MILGALVDINSAVVVVATVAVDTEKLLVIVELLAAVAVMLDEALFLDAVVLAGWLDDEGVGISS